MDRSWFMIHLDHSPQFGTHVRRGLIAKFSQYSLLLQRQTELKLLQKHLGCLLLNTWDHTPLWKILTFYLNPVYFKYISKEEGGWSKKIIPSLTWNPWYNMILDFRDPPWWGWLLVLASGTALVQTSGFAAKCSAVTFQVWKTLIVKEFLHAEIAEYEAVINISIWVLF